MAKLGEEIYDAFRDKNPMFVGVLNGCFIFMAALVRRVALVKSELEFIGVSSYNNGAKSSGVVQDHPRSAAGHQRPRHHRGGGHSGTPATRWRS